MSPETAVPAIMERIQFNIANGKRASKTLGRKLADMPIEQLARLPRSLLARLAPDAMAILAQASAGTGGILPPNAVAFPSERRSFERDLPPLWVSALFWAFLTIEITLITGSLELPTRWLLSRASAAPWEADVACNRLDQWTDSCSYTLHQSRLTLRNIAARLKMSPELLAAANPELPKSLPLAAHTIIRVDRSRTR